MPEVKLTAIPAQENSSSTISVAPHVEIGTPTSLKIVTRVSSHGAVTQTTEASATLSVVSSLNQPHMSAAVNQATSSATLSPILEPSIVSETHKMTPSPVHQSNIGIPGGFNPRQMANMPRLPGPVDINNPSYPTTSTPTKSDSIPNSPPEQISMPPMPSLASGFKLIDANPSAMDAISAGNLPFQETAKDVLSQPLTIVASVPKLATEPGSLDAYYLGLSRAL
jgi:hypothetical protein